MSLKGVLILNKTKTLNEKKSIIIPQLKLTVNRKCPICVMMAVHLHLPLKLTASSKIPFLYPHSVLTQSTTGFLECHEIAQQHIQMTPEPWCTAAGRPPCLETEGQMDCCYRSLLGWDQILILVQIEIRLVILFLKIWQEYLSLNTLIRPTKYFTNRNQREISKSHATLQLDFAFPSPLQNDPLVPCCQWLSPDHTHQKMFTHNVGRTQVLMGKFFISVRKRNARPFLVKRESERETGKGDLCFYLGKARRRKPHLNKYQLSSSLSLPGKVPL